MIPQRDKTITKPIFDMRQKWKTKAMIADDLKAHHEALMWNLALTGLYITCAAMTVIGVLAL